MRASAFLPLFLLLINTKPSKARAEASGACFTRSIYLNGVDISGAFSQKLQKVNLRIDEKGDIYIAAPHYQAFEADHYLPVSNYLKSLQTPVQQKPAPIPQTHNGPGPNISSLQPSSSGPAPTQIPSMPEPGRGIAVPATDPNPPQPDKPGYRSPEFSVP